MKDFTVRFSKNRRLCVKHFHDSGDYIAQRYTNDGTPKSAIGGTQKEALTKLRKRLREEA